MERCDSEISGKGAGTVNASEWWGRSNLKRRVRDGEVRGRDRKRGRTK